MQLVTREAIPKSCKALMHHSLLSRVETSIKAGKARQRSILAFHLENTVESAEKAQASW